MAPCGTVWYCVAGRGFFSAETRSEACGTQAIFHIPLGMRQVLEGDPLKLNFPFIS